MNDVVESEEHILTKFSPYLAIYNNVQPLKRIFIEVTYSDNKLRVIFLNVRHFGESRTNELAVDPGPGPMCFLNS